MLVCYAGPGQDSRGCLKSYYRVDATDSTSTNQYRVSRHGLRFLLHQIQAVARIELLAVDRWWNHPMPQGQQCSNRIERSRGSVAMAQHCPWDAHGKSFKTCTKDHVQRFCLAL